MNPADPEPDALAEAPRGGFWRRVALVALCAFVLGFGITALLMRVAASGKSIATVPNLRELSLAEAREALDASDLVLETMDSLPHAEVARLHILTQSPLPGQEVAPGTAVQVIVSSGRARYTIPRVEGLSRQQAEEVLRATGLQTVVEELHDARRAGLVMGTEPAAGTLVEVPAQVRLRVSLGPPLVGVPDLVGMRQDSAPAVLGRARLRVGEVRLELRFMGVEGEVLSQRPAAGDSVPAGSGVDLTIATTRLELMGPEDLRPGSRDGRGRRRER